jgi:arsenate reductase-like glutaredoxin family protein
VRERDFFREPLSRDELTGLLAGKAVAEALAWRSPRARELRLSPDSPPPQEELVRLMLEVPYLIRRPVIRIANAVVFGFDRRRLDAALAAWGR